MRQTSRKFHRKTHRIGIVQAQFLFHQLHNFLDLSLRFFGPSQSENRDGQVGAAIQGQTMLRTKYRFFEVDNLTTLCLRLGILSSSSSSSARLLRVLSV